MSRRRRRNESNVELLLTSPWQVTAGLAGAVAIAINVILPLVLGASGVGQVLLAALKPAGNVGAAILGMLALVVWLKQRQRLPQLAKIAVPADPASGTKFRSTESPNRDRVWEAFKEPVLTSSPAKPATWSLDLLREIEWKRFEEVMAAYFREKSFRAETFVAGPDGGIDIKLFAAGKHDPFAIVQCKAWSTRNVGVAPIRELLGVMTSEKVARGIFATTGEYSEDAITFGKQNPITLLTGEMILKGIAALVPEAQDRLLAIATEGEFTTPTCASCGVKLVRRESRNGPFWGCRNFPRCRTKMNLKGS